MSPDHWPDWYVWMYVGCMYVSMYACMLCMVQEHVSRPLACLVSPPPIYVDRLPDRQTHTHTHAHAHTHATCVPSLSSCGPVGLHCCVGLAAISPFSVEAHRHSLTPRSSRAFVVLFVGFDPIPGALFAEQAIGVEASPEVSVLIPGSRLGGMQGLRVGKREETPPPAISSCFFSVLS